jgi:predicted MFS family arabinose efflux permease
MYLVPLLVVVFVARMLHGVGWAGFNTAAPSMLSGLAPAARRGEAAGIYSTMPGLANVLAPAIALVLFANVGLEAAFLGAAMAGLGATVTAALVRAPVPTRSASTPATRALLERQALLPMTIEALWTSINALFFVFPPVLAAARGIPLDALPVYYMAAGIALLVGRASSSRILDHAERGTIILVGAALGAAALGAAALATTIEGLIVGGVLYALGMSAVSPATLALTLDRAEPRRMGAAMATYSLGYQLGVGLGAAIAGAAIDAFPLPVPYVLGLAGPVAMGVLVLARQDALGRPGRPAMRPTSAPS